MRTPCSYCVLDELERPRTPLKVRALGVGLFRLTLCFLAAVVIRGGQGPNAGKVASVLTLEQVREVFPGAALLGAGVQGLGAREVLDEKGRGLGSALRTSPETDEVVGYSGPSDLMIGLGTDGRIVAVRLLESGDTRAHVDQVRAVASYWRAFEGWDPMGGGELAVDAVSGSTLTSLAMAEGVERRLTGRVRSLRFPDAPDLEEARAHFPEAASLDRGDRGRLRVLDGGGELLGYLLSTSPQADNVRGYRGPSEALVALAPDGIELLGVSLRASYDTPEYVERVRSAEGFLAGLTELDAEAWSVVDYRAAGFEGVSGATRTSYGLVDGLRRSLAVQVEQRGGQSTWRGPAHELALVLLLLGACVMTYGPFRGRRRLRLAWQVLLVGVFGLVLGDLLSLALLAGWAREGLPFSVAPSLCLLGVAALVAPVVGRRQLYCHSLCPQGAAQEWVGRIRRWRRSPTSSWHRRLRRLPLLALAAAITLAVAWPRFDLAQLEAFDAWVLGGAAALSAGLALGGLCASLFVPMAYCRYGCPTGALLELLRGPAGGLRLKDWLAAGLIVALGLVTLARPAAEPRSVAEEGLRIRGGGFGTSWSVELRGAAPPQADWGERVREELARVERELSAWSPGSPVAQFNASATTLPVELPVELLELVAFGLELCAATDGAFDLSVGPLVDAWGAGPSGEVPSAPSAARLSGLLERVGWRKLELDLERGTLRKTHPELSLDLGALLQGHAADRVAAVLDDLGAREYLIEVGGELRARGAWQVAVEDPSDGDRHLRTLVLRDGALATSGSYRGRHLVSARTGAAVSSPWILCSTRARTALAADGWATALIVSGEEAPRLAGGEGLAALFCDEKGQLISVGGF